MATDTTEQRNSTGLASLVGDIIADAQELTRQQIDLVRVELRENAEKGKEIAMLFASGLALAVVAGGLLATSLALFLSWAIPSLPVWGGYAIVGAVLAILAGCLFGVCKQKLASFSVLPEKAVEAMQENLEWKTEPK